MPIKIKQVRQCSIGCTSDPISINWTDWLDSGETFSSGAVSIISGTTTGITLGSVGSSTSTYTERETGVTVATGIPRFTISCTTAVAQGIRTIEVSLTTSARTVPFELDINIV